MKRLIVCPWPGCENGTYGKNCNLKCGNCSQDAYCDPIDGRCETGCSDGFQGDKCDEGKTGCHDCDNVKWLSFHGVTPRCWPFSEHLKIKRHEPSSCHRYKQSELPKEFLIPVQTERVNWCSSPSPLTRASACTSCWTHSKMVKTYL